MARPETEIAPGGESRPVGVLDTMAAPGRDGGDGGADPEAAVDDGAHAEARTGTGSAVEGRGRIGRAPGVVWLATGLFGLVVALWTVAVPAYRAPDEAAHFDLVLYLAEGNGYPSWDGRFYGEAMNLDEQRHLLDSRLDWPRFDADDAPPRDQRPDVDDLGGVAADPDARPVNPDTPGWPYKYNQMPQHPPLYYLGMAGVLRAERWLLPGHDRPSLDRELGLLRLVNVLLVTPLPLLAWATVMRLTGGADGRAGLVASLLPLGLPQLAHIGGSLNNDNLFVLLGGVLCVLLAGVARGRRTRRTDVAIGVVLGLALLTKAFALMFVPWVVAAYLVGLWTVRRAPVPATGPASPARASVLGLALAGGVAAAVGAWWWIANWMREGEPAPTTENLTRQPGVLPAGFDPDIVEFGRTFARDMVLRTWGWVGYKAPKFELDAQVVKLLTVGVAAAVLVAVWRAVAERRAVAEGRERAAPRPVDVVLAWLPLALLLVFVFRRAWGLHQSTGGYAFIQGRYLFAALVGPMAIVAIGLAHTLRRGAVVVVLAVAAGLQAAMLIDVVQGSWSGDGRFGALSGALAWSPWPSALVVAAALSAVATAIALAITSVAGHDGTGRGRERQRGRKRGGGVPVAAGTG